MRYLGFEKIWSLVKKTIDFLPLMESRTVLMRELFLPIKIGVFNT
jgi:hypothetical protein